MKNIREKINKFIRGNKIISEHNTEIILNNSEDHFLPTYDDNIIALTGYTMNMGFEEWIDYSFKQTLSDKNYLTNKDNFKFGR